jgi:hypothetical protein
LTAILVHTDTGLADDIAQRIVGHAGFLHIAITDPSLLVTFLC